MKRDLSAPSVFSKLNIHRDFATKGLPISEKVSLVEIASLALQMDAGLQKDPERAFDKVAEFLRGLDRARGARLIEQHEQMKNRSQLMKQTDLQLAISYLSDFPGAEDVQEPDDFPADAEGVLTRVLPKKKTKENRSKVVVSAIKALDGKAASVDMALLETALSGDRGELDRLGFWRLANLLHPFVDQRRKRVVPERVGVLLFPAHLMKELKLT